MENKDLERAIYTWFNMKYELYNKLERDGSIYLYYEGHEYADIAIYKRYKNIYFKWNFWEEFSELFPIKFDEFSQFMTKWVADTFNLKRFLPVAQGKGYGYQLNWLKIPK